MSMYIPQERELLPKEPRVIESLLSYDQGDDWKKDVFFENGLPRNTWTLSTLFPPELKN